MAEFYVLSKDGKFVPAQYLRDKGARIPNPNPLPKGDSKFELYDSNGNRLMDEDQNVGNWYIVPEGYSLDDARSYADSLKVMDSEELGILALGSMFFSFWTGGPQDWQRKYKYSDGTPGSDDDPVPLFRHSTSFILGFVTARAGIPLGLAEIGGGGLNRLRKAQGFPVDTGGSYGVNPENLRSIHDGFRYSNRDAKPATYRGGRLYLDENHEVVRAKFEPGSNEATRGKQSVGRDVQLASYWYAPSNDSKPETVTPAMRALNAAKADDAFTKRYLKGDRDAVDRMHALHRSAFPEPGDATVRPAVRPDASDSSADFFSTARRDLTPARQALETAKTDGGFVKSYLDGDRNAFARMQSLIQAAHPEPDESRAAADGSGAQRDTANGATGGFAPWFGDALAGNALRDEGTDPTMAGWLGDWRDELRRPD